MRHRSSANADPQLPEWPTSAAKGDYSMFKEELEHNDDGMAFEPTASPKNRTFVAKFGKEDDVDSLVSGHSASRLEKKANLELVW